MFEKLSAEKSSWEILGESALPVVVYGTGNGADKVFDEFERLHIKVSAVAASDGFVRKRSFRGFEVKSFSQLEKELGDFIIAPAFASPRPEVIAYFKSLALHHKIIMPSVPIYESEIFNKDFLNNNLESIHLAFSRLADNQSKKVFENIIHFQITGNPDYCFDCETSKDEAFGILGLGENESFLDLGAYRGDTVEEFLKYAVSYKKIVAVEPDAKTFGKLKQNCTNLENCILLNNAIWSEKCMLTFEGNKGRGGSAGSYGQEAEAITVDNITEKYGTFTYIKADIEGAENEMLKGAKITLNQKPALCIAAYHKSEDIFSLVNKIYEINNNYKIYLRHHPHISFWDTNLYCI